MFRSLNSNKHLNDRFIPLRMPVNFEFEDAQNYLMPLDVDVYRKTEFVNYAKVRYNQINYQNALRNVLMPLDTRVLNFFPPKKFSQDETKLKETWPVKPRSRPLIERPEIILDMPDFDSNICHHVADWGSNNCIATIFGNEVHMWYPNSEFLRSVTSTRQRVQYCIKWRPEGTQLAVGLFPSRVGIWDIVAKKLISKAPCCRLYCTIYCLEWVNDNCLITGCSEGTLKMFTSNLKHLKQVSKAHKSTIINITTSCNKKFIATSGQDKTVTVWKLPELEGHFQITFASVVRALAWHPWKSSLLAVGFGHRQGQVTLWNVNTHKQIASEKNTYSNSTIDCLTFNPISGELVVSYFVSEDNNPNVGSGIIAVLTTIDEVVEELHIHDGRIPYLLWDQEGEILASASADENLCIWNFFGVSRKDKKLKETKKTKENCLENVNLFRTSIK